MEITQSTGYKQVSASGNVWPAPAILNGIFVSAASLTPTITVYDDPGTGTTTKLVDTFTPVVGWNPMPFRANKGINVVIGGTVSCTVGFKPETTV